MMLLNFGNLMTSAQKNRGQRGTLGTACIHAGLKRPQGLEISGDTWGQSLEAEHVDVPPSPALSPMSPDSKVEWGQDKPCIHRAAPIVPNVPTKKHKNEIDREAFEERAAILEFDGGLSRVEADRLAAELLEATP